MQIYPEIVLAGEKLIYPQGTGYYQPVLDVPNPLHLAVRWKNMGARWLHITHATNADASNTYLTGFIQQLTSMGLAIQVSTPLANLDAMASLFQAGTSRVFLSSQIDIQITLEILGQYGAEAVGIAFDAESNATDNLALGKNFYRKGGRYALCADTARVGTLSGIDLPRLNDFAIETQLDLISKGGVAHMSDLIKLKSTRQVVGVVLGRALYDGRIQLTKALALTK